MPRAEVLLVLGLVLVSRVALALWDHSIFWPDEIYQSVEQAHRIVYGPGFVPWEFRDGARSWFQPGLISIFFATIGQLGSWSGLALVALAHLVMGGVYLIGTCYTMALARGGGKGAGLSAGLLMASFPMLAILSHRVTSEAAAMTAVVVGVYYLRSGRATLKAAIALGIAALLRYQCSIIVAACFLFVCVRQGRRGVRDFALAGLGLLACVAVLDWITWGMPLHSLITYLRFNLLYSASTFGAEPPWFYFVTLATSSGFVFVAVVAGLIRGSVRLPWVAALCALFLVVHMVIPHKELRFLLPIAPLAMAIAGAGLAILFESVRPTLRHLALASIVLLFVFQSATATHGDFGYRGKRGEQSVWEVGRDINLALNEVGTRADACGVFALGVDNAFSGGYSYLHRDIPLRYGGGLCGGYDEVNYVIADTSRWHRVPAAYAHVMRLGDVDVFRRAGTCRATESEPYLEGAQDMGLDLPQSGWSSTAGLSLDFGLGCRCFGEGWGGAEKVDCRGVRWATARESRIHFRTTDPAGRYELRFSARPAHGLEAPSLRVLLDDTVLGEFALRPGWSSYRAPVEGSLLEKGEHVLSFQHSALRAPDADQRTLAVLYDALMLASPLDSLSVDLGTDRGSLYQSGGWHDAEREVGRAFSWIRGTRATLALPISPQPSDEVGLLLRGAPFQPTLPQSVQLSVNGRAAARVELLEGWRNYRVLLPPGTLEASGNNELELLLERSARPSEHEGTRDVRDLAMRLAYFSAGVLRSEFQLRMSSELASFHLLGGWDRARGLAPTRYRSFSISGEVVAFLSGSVDELRVQLASLDSDSSARPTVQVRVNGTLLGELESRAEWTEFSLKIPSGSVRAGANIVEFRAAGQHGRIGIRELFLGRQE